MCFFVSLGLCEMADIHTTSQVKEKTPDLKSNPTGADVYRMSYSV